eukprot:CAMPEP_0172563588 /NCGR_PEP_ID=MMETSP1067-20121228/101211_1 /TAXON_ID=265564 ORGANISM="Thalassiosira punctigera, Strain Tpunct2005C2" /NCGR_SAMPLE_ID=MMETSP1067 /ASSEMBLY_ACC=CAM_ASM_000444 /LENGTH=362 /DNA_ID=CAMNT_0013354063 /DNA_START=106 /DNA_END=1194 /DNA_ORIENTATION=+
MITPRHSLVAAASICTALLASTHDTPSKSLPAAFAFSHQYATTGRSWTSAIGAPLPPSPLRLNAPRRRGPLKHETSLFEIYFEEAFQPVKNGHSRLSLALHSKPRKFKYDIDLTALPSDTADVGAPSENGPTNANEPSSLRQDLRSIATLVGAQALLLPISYFLARALNVPNHGLGVDFAWTSSAATWGLKWTFPLFAVAGIMRLIEPYSEALQGVTRATQRSVLAVMGKERRLAFALLVSILLGAVAGWGEEWLFRGVFQTILSEKFSSGIALTICGVVFGLLHAVTPLYALLAGLASVFFGHLYNVSQNLAVPIICHAVYDVGALMWAHWWVTSLTTKEQDEILEGGPGAPIMSTSSADK